MLTFVINVKENVTEVGDEAELEDEADVSRARVGMWLRL
jgi:hypothetical protein